MNEYQKLIELAETNGVQIYFNTKILFSRTLGSNLKSADLIIRLLAIDNYFNKNNYGFELYQKMQETRINRNHEIANLKERNHKKEFEKIIKTFKENGYIESFPVELNKDFEVFDGAHRLACSLFFNIERIPVKFINEKYITRSYDYSINWFKNNGLGEFEKYIMEKYHSLVKEGMIIEEGKNV